MRKKINVSAFDRILESGVSDRLGRCFELSTKFVISHEDWTLVNGVITDRKFGTGNTLSHAWCEKGDMAYDPVMDHEMPTLALYSIYGVVDYRYHRYEKKQGIPETLKVEYSYDEVLRMIDKYKHYGPWDKRIYNYKGKINKRKEGK